MKRPQIAQKVGHINPFLDAGFWRTKSSLGMLKHVHKAGFWVKKEGCDIDTLEFIR